jgi:FMN-dependent NADH-azoreductase
MLIPSGKTAQAFAHDAALFSPISKEDLMQILHIDSSITGSNSVSRQLTAQVVDSLKQATPDAKVEYLDLAVSAPTHLSAQSLGFRTGQAAATEIERQENAISEALVSQFLASDVIVIGAPFYNFSIPSQLKAWLDRVTQAGRTFQYTAAGPEGLAKGKKVIVASTRGGMYSTSDMGQAMEHQESYLKVMFGFMGITDVSFVRAEGVAMGPEAKAKALETAQAMIEALEPVAA